MNSQQIGRNRALMAFWLREHAGASVKDIKAVLRSTPDEARRWMAKGARMSRELERARKEKGETPEGKVGAALRLLKDWDGVTDSQLNLARKLLGSALEEMEPSCRAGTGGH